MEKIRNSCALFSTIVWLIFSQAAAGFSGPAEIRSVDPLASAAPANLQPLALPADRPATEKIQPSLWEAMIAVETEKEPIRIIVLLHEPIVEIAEVLSPEEKESIRLANVARVEHDFVGRAEGIAMANVRGLSHFPIVVADVTRRDLVRLAAIPTVKSLERVYTLEPTRAEGGALMRATMLRNSFGGHGSGVGVAVIDSGVDDNHPEMAGRVVAQADYSGGGDGTIDGLSHGTSVAGIIAGNTAGMAPKATIWALKVFYNDGSSGSSDWMLEALNSAYAHRTEFGGLHIINMSLGVPSFIRNYACDAEAPAFAAIVNQLAAVGMPVFVAAGNESRRDGISFPACLSNAIAVGAVTDGPVFDPTCPFSYGSADQILCYSNSGVPLDLLAPSACAHTPRSSWQGGGYQTCFNGTSAASPYAAGVAAQLLSLRPNTTHAQLRNAMVTSGRPITDANNITRNRIDAVQAYQTLGGGGTSGGPCVDSPTTLCLLNKRYKVEARYRTASGQIGDGKAVRLTEETGYFWFFNESNIEAVFKLLNGCGINNRFWVFAGGLTDVEVSTTITDTKSGSVRSFNNPLGTAFRPIADSSAFATCP